MKFQSLAELPAVHRCRKCGKDKPVAEMVVVHLRRSHLFYVRPRCKDCHNRRERGHRREWKTKYLRRWRARNPELNESYWRQRNADNRKALNASAYRRFQKHHAAILIQGRMGRRGFSIRLAEAKDLCRTYGPCYPTRFGLTPGGLKECERIRSRMRYQAKPLPPHEIRMMVYADGFFIKPGRQKIPYQKAAEKLRQWHAQRREAAVA
jgi:hypothetical protein